MLGISHQMVDTITVIQLKIMDTRKETIKDLTAQNLKLKSENKKYKNLLGIIDNKQKSSNNSMKN